ncbi:TonB-dependent receptor family protein [Methyloglobulus sp.]|uniref:TonB-dependent receptor family protein n=1 Tax=Methyloglobulus sp. TaxID=2518622 RepID=UPI00398A0AE5
MTITKFHNKPRPFLLSRLTCNTLATAILLALANNPAGAGQRAQPLDNNPYRQVADGTETQEDKSVKKSASRHHATITTPDKTQPIIELETMVVTGKSDQKLAAARAEVELSPGGVSLVDIKELHERNVSSIADFFRYVPGVWAVSQFGNEQVTFSSRGSNLDSTDFDRNGVKFLQDGLPVTAADGNNHNRLIDPLAASFATVARGANALKYGASTLGGAVDFTTPTAHNGPAMNLSLNGGSFGQFLGRGTVSRVFNDSLDGLLTVEGRVWDGYRAHNQQDRFGLYSNFGWQISDSIVNRTFVSYLKNNQELPGQLTRAQFDTNPNQASRQAIGGNLQLNVETERVANKTTWTIDDKSSLDIGFSFENQQLYHPIVDKVLVDFDGPGPLPPREVFSLLVDSIQQDWGTSARYNLHLDSHELLLGVNFGTNSDKGGNYRNDGGRRNGLTNQITKKADNVEIFAQDHWHITDKWTLTPALQGVFAHREVNNIGVNPVTNALTGINSHPDANYSGINPSLGLMYNMTKNSSVYGNVSRLYEPPTNFNLADNTITNAGGATLKAMEGTSIEIGTRGNQNFGVLNSVSWDLSLYYSWLHNEILSVSPVAGLSLAKNIDSTIHAGVEGLVSAKLDIDGKGTHSLEPMLTFTVNHFTFDDDPLYGNNDLPAAPDYFLRGEVLYRHASGFFLGPTYDVVGKRWADFENTYKIDSYGLLGLRTGWSNDHYKVFFEARNLLDTAYVTNHNVLDRAAANAQILNPGAPLSFYGGMEISF